MTTGIMKRDNGRTNLPATSFSGLVDQFFQNNLNRFFEDSYWGFDGVNRQYNIPVNLQETDKHYDLQLVAPGLKKEDFAIKLEGDLLTVSFEHNVEKNENDKRNEADKSQRWLRKEFNIQSFTRSFTLDNSLDAAKITARYHDGILHLVLPKKEAAQRLTRSIEIN